MFSWLRRIADKKKTSYRFTDEDRARSEVNRLAKSVQQLQLEAKKNQLKKLKEKLEMRLIDEDIEDIQDELDDDNEEYDEEIEESPNQLFFNLLSKILSPQTQSSGIKSPPIPEEDVSDEEIDEMIKQIPNEQIKMIKKTPIGILRPLASEKFPGVSEKTIARAIQKIKN